MPDPVYSARRAGRRARPIDGAGTDGNSGGGTGAAEAKEIKLTRPFQTLAAEITALNFKWVPIQHAHCHELAGLPLHHRDPFDRLLVAQARVEGLKIVSLDPVLRAYDADCVW